MIGSFDLLGCTPDDVDSHGTGSAARPFCRHSTVEAVLAGPHDTKGPAREELKLATEVAEARGVTSPTAWWRLGLVALAIVIALLLAMQVLGGNKGTGVVPGTPVAAPQSEQSQ